MEKSILQELQESRDLIKQIGEKHRAKTIRIFGSVARKEEQATSDIDLLVEFNKDASLFDLINLKLDMEKIYGRKVDVVTPASLNKKIAISVMNEALEL